MLFLLVMEVFHAIISKVDDWLIFKKVGVQTIPFHMSLYADDMILFLSPVSQDLQTT
jgi:hypothetical protein